MNVEYLRHIGVALATGECGTSSGGYSGICEATQLGCVKRLPTVPYY